jgi:hypothetical protein
MKESRDSIPMTLAQALRGRRKVRVWVRKPNQGTGGQRGDIPKKFLAMNGFLREGGTRWHAVYEDSLKVGYATVIVSLESIVTLEQMQAANRAKHTALMLLRGAEHELLLNVRHNKGSLKSVLEKQVERLRDQWASMPAFEVQEIVPGVVRLPS